MVEKIIVSPDSVRGWGNIVMEHTVDDYALVGSSILVDSDTVMGVESVVYTIEAEDSSISVALVSSVASCSIGDSIVLSATVTDDSVAVEGGTVTFKLNTTTLGTDETDANGVATYTYTTTDVGSLNFTALYESHNSNTVSVVVSHDYSIAFDSSSYTTSTGDVTCYVTLLDNSVAVSGASISLTGTGTTVTATTNSSGVATFNLTGISSDCTITATYDNVSDTATITVQSGYIVDISGMTDQSSEFGSILDFRSTGNSGSGSMSYDSTNHYYVLASTGTGQERFIPITALTGLNNFKLTFEAQVVTTHLFGFGEFVGSTNTNCSVYIGTDDGHFKKHQGSDTNISTGASSGTWYSFTVTVDSTGYYVTIKDLNDNVKVDNYRCTISNSNTTQYGFTWGWQGSSQRFYLRNIKAESL